MFSLASPFPMLRQRRRWGRCTSAFQRIARLDARPWSFIGLGLLTVAVIVYLALANEYATAGYELRSLEHRADVLREDVRALELQTLAEQSHVRLLERIADAGYVPVASVQYIGTGDRAVAQR